jgi:hypothetical protein
MLEVSSVACRGEPCRRVANLRKFFRKFVAVAFLEELPCCHISAAEKPRLAARKIAVTHRPSVCLMTRTSS